MGFRSSNAGTGGLGVYMGVCAKHCKKSNEKMRAARKRAFWQSSTGVLNSDKIGLSASHYNCDDELLVRILISDVVWRFRLSMFG